MKLKRSPTPLEQAEHWIVHWLSRQRQLREGTPDWEFALEQLGQWLDKWREISGTAGQRV